MAAPVVVPVGSNIPTVAVADGAGASTAAELSPAAPQWRSPPRARLALPPQAAMRLLWALAVWRQYTPRPLVALLASALLRPPRAARRRAPPALEKMLTEARLLLAAERRQREWRPLAGAWCRRTSRAAGAADADVDAYPLHAAVRDSTGDLPTSSRAKASAAAGAALLAKPRARTTPDRTTRGRTALAAHPRARCALRDVFDARAWQRLEGQCGGLTVKAAQRLRDELAAALASLGFAARWRLLPTGERVCWARRLQSPSDQSVSASGSDVRGQGSSLQPQRQPPGTDAAAAPAQHAGQVRHAPQTQQPPEMQQSGSNRLFVLCLDGAQHRAANSRRRVLAGAVVRDRLLAARGATLICLPALQASRMDSEQRQQWLRQALTVHAPVD